MKFMNLMNTHKRSEEIASEVVQKCGYCGDSNNHDDICEECWLKMLFNRR